MIDLVFEASIADVLEHYIDDERLKTALFGQGIIGTWGGPYEPGTASIKLMHYQGDLDGQGPVWGYVEGGMGMCSFAIADAAAEDGAVLACGVPVARITPGEGVTLEDGTELRARTVICNADPKRMAGLLADAEVDARLPRAARRVEDPQPGGQVQRPPRPAAELDRGAGRDLAGAGDVDATGTMAEAQAAFERCERRRARGRLRRDLHPDRLRPEPGAGGQAPDERLRPVRALRHRRRSNWDAARDGVAKQFIDLISRFAPDFPECLAEHEVLGPPDIESRIGLTGGNIFQGEVTPDQMWEGRFAARTPVEGLYMCGAATHPAGSVIALNGRNAASAVLADQGASVATA